MPRTPLVASAAVVAALAVDPEVERAQAVVRDRATSGDTVAQFSLASILYYRDGEVAEAIDWLRRAAAREYVPAEFQLGQLHDFGFGVAPDTSQALAWYRKAADHGSAPAQRTLGEWYLKGRGVAASPTEAEQWLGRAADGDDIRAQYLLGELYLSGAGVPRDYVSAYMWLDLAANQAPLRDNRLALIELRDIAAARMTQEQVAEAQRRASTWKPSFWSAPLR